MRLSITIRCASVVFVDYPRFVRIVEVGPRDGLQNERRILSVTVRVSLIEALVRAGLKTVECGSFVSPDRVPQMAGTAAVLTAIQRRDDVAYPVLVPNQKGLEAALHAGASEIAIFASASETFSQRNINCSIEESMVRLRSVAHAATKEGLTIRGYVSCVLGCPYEGHVSLDAVVDIARQLREMGCYEISLGDTIGVGTPLTTQLMLEAVGRLVPIPQLAVHFHDTWGQALANILCSVQMGVSVVDSSVAGLGGCPYAPGATGNVATEDVVYMLQGMGINTGLNLEQIAAAGKMICGELDRNSGSKVALAMAATARLH